MKLFFQSVDIKSRSWKLLKTTFSMSSQTNPTGGGGGGNQLHRAWFHGTVHFQWKFQPSIREITVELTSISRWGWKDFPRYRGFQWKFQLVKKYIYIYIYIQPETPWYRIYIFIYISTVPWSFRRGFHFTVKRMVPCTLFVGLNKRYVSHLLTNKNTFYVAGIHTDFFYCRVICMHFSLHSLEKKGISRLHGTVDLHNNITKSTHFLFSEASPYVSPNSHGV